MTFELRVEWEDAPGVALPALRETWARIEFRLDGRPMTQFYSERTHSLRDGVCASAFPLARWVVDNWWLILDEGLHHLAALKRRSRLEHEYRRWFRRHNLLVGREGMAYPDLTLFRTDDAVTLIWRANRDSTTTDGWFITSDSARVSRDEMEAALDNFVSAVIERLAEIEDEEVDEFRATWSAIRASRREERELCSRMALLGIDPYDPDPDEDLESALRQISLTPAVVRDLLAATTKSSIESDLAAATCLLDKLPQSTQFPAVGSQPLFTTTAVAPYRAGYEGADALRRRVALPADEPVRDLPGLVGDLFAGFRRHWVDGETLGIEAAVQGGDRGTLVAMERHPTAKRFVLARGVYYGLHVTTSDSPRRLLTRSHDWQQAASRAFAAELLAPKDALKTRLGNRADWEDLSELAEEFGVSPLVIVHQIENHGLG